MINQEMEREISEASLMENARRAVQVIIRPPRASYAVEALGNIVYDWALPPIARIPIAFRNHEGVNLIGSVYLSSTFDSEQQHRCVIYLHGNVGSQQEGRFLVPHLAPRGISVFCFDFSGSGLSGGEFVTLGFKEHRDVLDSMDFLNRQFHISDFVLWGRSMGAACAVLAAPLSPLIRGIIVDSAYSSVSSLFASIASKTPLPSIVRPVAVWWIKREVGQRGCFNCNKIRPRRSGKKSRVPLMLGHCTDDDFIPYSHGVKIFKGYGGTDKEMMTLVGGHNGKRDPGWLMKCVRFILRVFGLGFQYFEVEITQENVEHAASWAELMAKAD